MNTAYTLVGEVACDEGDTEKAASPLCVDLGGMRTVPVGVEP